MAGGDLLLGNNNFLADGAPRALGQAILCAGGSLAGNGLLLVALGKDGLFLNCFADGAGPGLFAILGTGGVGHRPFAPFVAGGNLLLGDKNFLADGALCALGQAILGAGGSLAGDGN